MLVIGDPVDAETLAVRAGIGRRRSRRTCACARSQTRCRCAAQAAARRGAAQARSHVTRRRHRLESDLNLLVSTTADRAEGIAVLREAPPTFTGE
jgi:hypothetical protein